MVHVVSHPPMGWLTLVTEWHVQQVSEAPGGVQAHICPWLRAVSRINLEPAEDQLELVIRCSSGNSGPI